MLSNKTKKRISEHKWNEHSNTSLFFQRLDHQADEAIKDLTLLASNLEEKQFRGIFTIERLEPFIQSLVRTKGDINQNFMMGYLLLKWSLNYTGAMLDNWWAKELYRQHEAPLRDMLEMLRHEKAQALEGVQQSLVEE